MPLPVEVINRQRKTPIDRERWEQFTKRALQAVPTEASGVTIVFISDRQMRGLNRQWRGKNDTTDVLSFPGGDDSFANPEGAVLGDVVISIEQALRQAKDNRLSLDEEVAQLILHGLLHLCGYDHETDSGEMNRLEIRLRQKLGIHV